MKVKMRTTYAGPLGVASPGKVIDLPTGAAHDLIERGYASQIGAPVLGDGTVESAMIGQPETAMLPAAKWKRPK